MSSSSSSMNIDPTSPEHRVSDQYMPDKADTWDTPAGRDVWALTHDAIRLEMKDLRNMFEILQQRDQELTDWECEAIKTAVICHADHVKYHLKSQDEILVPELRKRFKYPEEFVNDDEHICQLLDDLRYRARDLKPTDKIDHVFEAWNEYEGALLSHLKEEEEKILPLFRAYFSPKEAAKITKKTLKEGPVVEAGSLVHSLGPESFKEDFMREQDMSTFAWFMSYGPKYRAFQHAFVKNVEAVKTGQKPSVGPAIASKIIQ